MVHLVIVVWFVLVVRKDRMAEVLVDTDSIFVVYNKLVVKHGGDGIGIGERVIVVVCVDCIEHHVDFVLQSVVMICFTVVGIS